MKYVPHDYQQYATDYIETHPIAAVLLDMGLGKTAITLTALLDLLFDSFEAHKVLVIAPLRVARDTWPAEIEKWDHLQMLTYSVAVGTEKERKAALMRDADIYIINRENVQWLIEQSGLPFNFDTVIVDELSSFKSHQSKRFKALIKVRPRIRRIVGLTGTPSANGLMDLWAEFKILDMGQRLGRFIGMYRNNYFTPDKRNGQIIYSYRLLPGADKAIYQKISDITISMKAADHLKMPELVMNNYVVELSDDEAERYEELRQTLVLQLPEADITVANAAVLSGKLLQMANGAIYDDDGQSIRIHDRKLDALEDHRWQQAYRGQSNLHPDHAVRFPASGVIPLRSQ
jgi:SNF2 family DNA or RNA helicase